MNRTEERLVDALAARAELVSGERPVPAAVVPLRRSRTIRTAALGAVAAAAAAALVVGLTAGSDGSPAARPRPDAQQLGTAVAVQPAAATAPALLDQLATAVAGQPGLTVSPDQFVYVRSISGSAGYTSLDRQGDGVGPAVVTPVHQRQVWLPQRAGVDGWIDEPGADGDPDAVPIDYGGAVPDDTYAALAALPTDPTTLLQQLRTDPSVAQADPGTADLATFQLIGNLLAESIAPPEVIAALYRAAALVPGVVVVPDAVDAAGRHGVAVAREDPLTGERHEWILDQRTSSYLGARSYLTRDTTLGRAGMLTGISAVLERGVADEVRQVPDAEHLLR